MDLGSRLKNEGMDRAAVRRKECLTACRRYLVLLAMADDGTATADDAREYIRRMNLEPLGNAAGSLFHNKWWKATGELRASSFPSLHAHKNFVWELQPDKLPKGFK